MLLLQAQRLSGTEVPQTGVARATCLNPFHLFRVPIFPHPYHVLFPEPDLKIGGKNTALRGERNDD